jgi:16S rRNA (cytosine1402-N4)-methyltransferase
MYLNEETSLSAASRQHVAVMVDEVVGLVRASKPLVIVDATLGTGGHAEALLETTGAQLIGLDRDRDALRIASARLERFGSRVSLHHANFADLGEVLDHCGMPVVGAIVADLGMSSFALNNPARGFSFMIDGPLDMRMDAGQQLSAYALVNEETEEELARIIHDYGQEHHARRIARALVVTRRRGPIETTGELRLIIEGAVGGRRRGGINPATRTFQALRIAVNGELASLAQLLDQAPSRLAAGGRMLVLAYHSLEDTPVKRCFRELAETGNFQLLSRRAIRPQLAEVARNRRARSARLRCVERKAS